MRHCRLVLPAIFTGPCPSDSEWTRRESNPVHRTCALALARFDTNLTPIPTTQISKAKTVPPEICSIIQHAVVPPILFYSVICLARREITSFAGRRYLPWDGTAATGSRPIGAQPTCLAPGWTFAQPPLSPTTLVGFYPTVSALTLTFRRGRDYFLLQLSSPTLRSLS